MKICPASEKLQAKVAEKFGKNVQKNKVWKPSRSIAGESGRRLIKYPWAPVQVVMGGGAVRSSSKKRKSEDDEDEDDEDGESLRLNIAPALKKVLVEDHEQILNKNSLLRLPRYRPDPCPSCRTRTLGKLLIVAATCSRKPCVDDILDDFLDTKQKHKDVTAEVLEGVRLYFKSTLGSQLLYASERTQYANVKETTGNVLQVYGVEHLLRLFVKLPDYVESTGIERETVATLQSKLSDLLKFIQKNVAQFTSGRAYVDKASAEKVTKASLGIK
eukprot:scaffold4437_cov391-Prasinococcus_capsulatus_cf.AAC.16